MGSDGSLIFDTDLDTKGFERGSSKLQNAINSLLKSVDRIGNMDISTPKQIAKFQDQVAKARSEVESMRQKLEDLGSKTISTADYEALTKSISEAEKSLLKLYDRQELMRSLGVNENSNQWKRLQLQIQDAEAAVKRYENQKAQMEADGSAFVSGVDTEQYARLNAELEEAEAKLAEYVAAAEQAADGSGGLKAMLHGIGTAALSAAKNLALLPLNAVSDGFKKAASGIKEYIKNIGKSHSGTRGLLKGLTSLKTMLFSRVKRMFISNIFNEMKEAMNALQQYDKSFGTAMNSMKNAAKGLSANLAVSFGGLISAIEPVLTKIISAISTAISYINALFAMLSGKGTVTVAKKQMDGYAKATGGAAGAAKELNKQLMGFDELNRLSDNSDSGGGGTNPADLFEEVPIDSLLPDSVKDYFERIKAAFDAGDWESIGSIIAEGLNSGMGVVDDWVVNVLQPLAFQWAVNAAGALNGFVSGLDWALVGKTISDGLITILNTITAFIENVDWQMLGRKTAELISGIDWGGVTSALFRGIGAALGGLAAFLWGLIQDAWNSIVNWWENTAYEDGQFTMEGLLNGILEKIKDIGTWIKNNIFEPFMTGFKNAFGIHSPSTVMQEQGNFIIDGLLNGIKNTWSKITSFFSNAVQTVITEFRNTPWADIGINICNGITEGLSNGWNWLVQTVSDIAGGLLNAAKSILGIHSPSRVFRDQVGENIGLGLAEGIENSEKDVNRSVAALAKSTVAGFNTDGLSINVAGSEMVSGLDRVADKLSAIANTFQAITAMLDSVGSLVVPEIATGTVAPYKTRILSTPNGNNQGDYAGKTDPAKIDNIINLLSEVIRVVKDIDPTVVIDEDMIGMAATRYQNRRKLSLGG